MSSATRAVTRQNHGKQDYRDGKIDFEGFKDVVEVLGKVCVYIDEDTTSIHFGHDDKTVI